MSADFAAPGMSFGTYSSLGQVESRGFRYEPFTVRAAVNTALGYTDNAGLTDNSNKKSSMLFLLNPSVAVGLEGARHRYYGVYRGNYGQYLSSSQDSYDDHSLGVSASDDWSTRFRTLAAYEFTRGHTPGGVISPGLRTPVEWNAHTVRGTASYGAEGAPGRLEAAAGYRSWRYVTDRETMAASDYDTFDLGGTFLYRVAPKTRAVVQITYANIRHPNNPTLDNTEMRYMLGATWEALATTQGSVRAGVITKSFDSSAFSDFSGPALEGSLRWAPRTYSVVELSARRFLSESYITGSNFAVNNYASVVWNYEWYGRYRSTLQYGYGRSTLEGLDRSDTYHDIGLRGSYGVTRSLRLGAEVRHDTRSSTGGGLEYNRNTVLLILETAI